MSYEIAIMNPRQEGSKMSKARRNSKGRFVKATSKKRRRNPKRRKHVAKASAPRRRRRASTVRASAPRRRRRRSHTVARRRRHRNPRFSLAGIGRGIVPQLTQAGIGAVGALGLDILIGYIPLPDVLKTGLPRHAVKIAGALGLGMVAGKVLGQKTGHAVANGALTVALYGLVKELAVKFLPASIPGLAGGDEYNDVSLGYMDSAPWIEDARAFNAGRDVNNVGAYMDGMGAYMEENQGTGAYMDL